MGPMLSRALHQAELMDRMMECLGVDPATAARLENGMAWYDARSQCIGCHSERRRRSAPRRGPLTDHPISVATPRTPAGAYQVHPGPHS
jgi:hypothetical protein